MRRPILIVDFEATCRGPEEIAPEPLLQRVCAGGIIEFRCVVLRRPRQSIARIWQQYVYVHPLSHP